MTQLLAPFAPLYLASNSPRRRQILEQLGIVHEVLKIPSPAGQADEPILAGEAAEDYVQRTAQEKMQDALFYIQQQALSPKAVLCADTCVMLDHKVVDKARSDADVRQSLHTLSDTWHQVHTYVVLQSHEQRLECRSVSWVKLQKLSATDIEHYVRSQEGLGKAGGYAVQGLGAAFIEAIKGSYSGIMGLPAHETWQLLQRLNV
ncbi:Maf family protein [Brackiella oedipodis]|uniref:Maf family protein n=1 Tax=Brackiella oedipodis TaxID=124225 RepID=UPI00048F5475|nr:nucleoside triphosphate pyrophosphatase [Brackiella oedipodis]